MEIGKTYLSSKEAKLNSRTPRRSLNDLTPGEKKAVLANHKEDWDPKWDNEDFTGQGLVFPNIAAKHGNPYLCTNDEKPDTVPPKELFNFDLILNSRRFQVTCDTILRLNSEENLADFSERQILNALEMCSSYRLTCYCAYISAHREYRKWQEFHELWLAEKRTEARTILRTKRLADKAMKLRKDMGQITMTEIEDYILVNHSSDHKHNLDMVGEWEENEKVFLELRDTLKDRGMHLQSILKRVSDNTDKHMMSDGNSSDN